MTNYTNTGCNRYSNTECNSYSNTGTYPSGAIYVYSFSPMVGLPGRVGHRRGVLGLGRGIVGPGSVNTARRRMSIAPTLYNDYQLNQYLVQ